MRWTELKPEQMIVDALDYAGIRPERGTQNQKRRWSERFADGCAVAVANEFTKFRVLSDKRILPTSLKDGTEPLTPLGSGTRKRIDVIVVDPVLGLEIGASLKGLNFEDSRHKNYDKNLTGRLYELGDEVRLVHEHLPHAFMAAVFFLPIASTQDKSEKARSSFAHTVAKLRERTGRLDPALNAHASRCDMAFVGLYSNGSEIPGVGRGVTRFLNVSDNPPFRGRPTIDSTCSLAEMVKSVVERALNEGQTSWADPETD